MDALDKQILISMLKSGRYSTTIIATETGISPQLVNYRLKKMLDSNIIKSFKIHLNPYYFNARSVFVAFEGSNISVPQEATSIFKCLEKLYFFELQMDDQNQIEWKIKTLSEKYGNLVMKYSPRAPSNIMPLNNNDLQILKILAEKPTTSILEISNNLNTSPRKIRKRIDLMRDHNVFNIIPIIDLSKVDFYFYAFFSKNPFIINNLKGPWTLRIKDESAGIFIGAANSIAEIKKNLEIAKEVDNNTEVMMIYEYDFNPNGKFLEKVKV